MKIKDMKPGIHYLVASYGNGMYPGDQIGFVGDYPPTVDSLWAGKRHLDRYKWRELDNEVEVDIDYYRIKRHKALQIADDYQKIINEAERAKLKMKRKPTKLLSGGGRSEGRHEG